MKTYEKEASEMTKRITQFNMIIDSIENRCMAADGPVTPTLKEATEDELSELWRILQEFRSDFEFIQEKELPSFDELSNRSLTQQELEIDKHVNKLEEIKDQLATEFGYTDWEDLSIEVITDKHWPEVCKRYATECCKATLEKAANNAQALIGDDEHGLEYPFVSKGSITEESNITLL
jgi:hypothetical protein